MIRRCSKGSRERARDSCDVRASIRESWCRFLASGPQNGGGSDPETRVWGFKTIVTVGACPRCHELRNTSGRWMRLQAPTHGDENSEVLPCLSVAVTVTFSPVTFAVQEKAQVHWWVCMFPS